MEESEEDAAALNFLGAAVGVVRARTMQHALSIFGLADILYLQGRLHSAAHS
jgi:hypothetical protein